MTAVSDPPIMIYTTFPSIEAAEEVGSALVEMKLAACVNILPQMLSIYEWQGKMEKAQEAVMLIKTRKSCQQKAVEETTSRHPYDTPAVLVIDITGGNNAYFRWIADQTTPQAE